MQANRFELVLHDGRESNRAIGRNPDLGAVGCVNLDPIQAAIKIAVYFPSRTPATKLNESRAN